MLHNAVRVYLRQQEARVDKLVCPEMASHHLSHNASIKQ